MNPIFDLAREMQTPSAHFEANLVAALEILAELNKRTEPECMYGMYEYAYECGPITLICHLEYEPAERGSRQGGVQMEPDYPDNMTLHAAYIGSIDVSGGLDSSVVEEIETLAMEAWS